MSKTAKLLEFWRGEAAWAKRFHGPSLPEFDYFCRQYAAMLISGEYDY